MENSICKEHSGLVARIVTLEGNVAELWKKWNGMQKIIIIFLLSNMIGMIVLLIETVGK